MTTSAQAVAGRLFPGVGNQHAAVGARCTEWTSQPVEVGRAADGWSRRTRRTTLAHGMEMGRQLSRLILPAPGPAPGRSATSSDAYP